MASSKVSRKGALVVGWLAVMLAVGVSACGDGSSGGGGGVVSCTISETISGLDTIMLCEEGPANQRQQLQQSCMVTGADTLADAGITATARLVDGPCSHVGALGACRFTTAGVSASIWYYAGSTDGGTSGTPADIQMLCVAAGATYVAP